MTEDRFVDLGGARFHYLDWGGSGDPLLLLAGLGCTAHVFGELAPLLNDRFRVVGLTRRGHGDSAPLRDAYSLADGAEDARRFLDTLGIDRAHVVGHSMGGGELSELAVRHPGRVDRVVYLDGALDWADNPMAAMPEEATGPEEFPSFEAYVDHVHGLVGPDVRGAAFEAMLRASVEIREDGSIAERHTVAAMTPFVRSLSDYRHPYGEIAAPALACYALADQWPEPIDTWLAGCRRRFADEVRDARVVELRASHYLFLDRRDDVLAAIRDFLT